METSVNTPVVQKKEESVTQKLGIHISVNKVSQIFTSLGINKQAEEEFSKSREKIDLLKKKGAPVVPKFTAVCPKRLTAEEKKDTYLVDRKKKEREAYHSARAEQDELERLYSIFASEEYKTALLAFRLKRKLEELLKLAQPAKSVASQEKRDVKVAEMKKTICNFSHKSWNLTYAHVYPTISEVVNSENWRETVPVAVSTLNTNHKSTNDLFVEKDSAESKKTRFGEAVRFACTFIAQEALKSVMVEGIKACNRDGRITVKREDLSTDKIDGSPFSLLFADLKATKSLDDFMKRKEVYNKYKLRFDGETKEDKIKGTFVRTFEDTEITGKFAKEVKGKKVWYDLSVGDNISFCTYIAKVFNLAKESTNHKKFHLSTGAKEYLSVLLLHFLEKLNKQIAIVLKRNSLKVQKTFDTKSLFMIISLLLVSVPPDNKEVSNLFTTTKEMLVKLEALRNPKAAEVKTEEVKVEEVKTEEVKVEEVKTENN